MTSATQERAATWVGVAGQNKRRWSAGHVVAALTLLVLGVLVAAVRWRILGGQWFVIQTPSMGQAAPVGTLVFTEPSTVSQLDVGDLITYRPPSATWQTYTHRIVDVAGDTVRTRGDINGAVDPWALRGGDIVGKVVARWWGIGWLLRGLPVLVAGAAVVGLISRYWVSLKHRTAFRLLAGSVVIGIAGVIIKPYVGFAKLSAAPDAGGVSATLVSTGILPIRVSSHDAGLDLVAGQVGTITDTVEPADTGIHLFASPHMSWQGWLVWLVVAASPLLWVLIVGAAPLDREPPPRPRPTRRWWPTGRARILSAGQQRRGVAAAVVLIMLGAAGLPAAPTRSAFVGAIANSANTAGSNAYFTCTEAEPGIGGGAAYFVWPLAETSTASPAADISGNHRPGVYSGTVTPNPHGQPCARDTGGTMTFGINGAVASDAPIGTAPDTLTESIWFQTTHGGRLIGLGNSRTGTSTVYDRQLWIDDTGHVVFSTHDGTYHQATSPLSYNDNTWHQATASLSAAGMALYVDGALVATNAATSGTAFTPGPFINLRSAATFAAIGSAVTSTGISVLNGDLGVTATVTATGFPPGVVNGVQYIDDAAAARAKKDTKSAYDQVRALTPTDSFAGDQNGRTFGPGVHFTGGAFELTGTLTLDAHGDPNAVFIFQVDAALNTAAGSRVVLVNGAQAANVYWQAHGAIGTGANSTMVGTLLGDAALTLGADSSLNGRALVAGANTLASNTIDIPPAGSIGYFRVGYDNMAGVPNRPSDPSFTGDLGFAAVYLRALTAAEVKTAYIAGT